MLQPYLSISKIFLHLNVVLWTILLTYLPTDIVIFLEFIKVFIFWIEKQEHWNALYIPRKKLIIELLY